MKLVCGFEGCNQELESTLTSELDALNDLVSLLKSHVRHKHKEEFLAYEEDVKDVIKCMKILPSYMFLSAFVDLESFNTSDQISKTYDEMVEALEPLIEIFSEETEADETEELEPIVESTVTAN